MSIWGFFSCAYLPLAPKDVHLLVRHSLMLLLEGRSDLALEFDQKLFLPESERLGVVPANILDLLHDQSALGLSGNMVKQLCDGRKIATREDIVVDKTEIKCQ